MKKRLRAGVQVQHFSLNQKQGVGTLFISVDIAILDK